MARLFNDAASDSLKTTSFPAIVEPFTLAGWGNADANPNSLFYLSLGDASATDYHAIGFKVPDPALKAQCFSFDGSSGGAADTTTFYSLNTWHHICGVFSAANARAIYLDGGGKNTDATNVGVTAEDRIAIGVSADNTPAQYMSGHVAECAIWDVALTDAEAAILAAGYSPLFVRPQNLVGYWPLVRGLNSRVGTNPLTASGTSVSNHPRIIYPSQLWVPHKPAAVTGNAGIMTTNSGYWGPTF